MVAAFITFTREGTNTTDGKKAFSLVDNQMKSVTAPMLEPILEMYHQEGNPDVSSFKNFSPMNELYQKYTAGNELNFKLKFID